jgi:hypothetical protein
MAVFLDVRFQGPQGCSTGWRRERTIMATRENPFPVELCPIGSVVYSSRLDAPRKRFIGSATEYLDGWCALQVT